MSYFDILGGAKDVTSKQCEGYALVTITQRYYADRYPWCLFSGAC
jgi:hypothetical protein